MVDPENKENREYTDFIETWLKQWVGYAEESVFEVNMLVINTELVFCSNYNKGVFDYLKKIGMTSHIKDLGIDGFGIVDCIV